METKKTKEHPKRNAQAAGNGDVHRRLPVGNMKNWHQGSFQHILIPQFHLQSFHLTSLGMGPVVVVVFNSPEYPLMNILHQS